MLDVGGTLLSAILRLVVTVGILAAVYFLIVRPVLDTTKSVSHDISRSVNHSVNAGLHSANHALNQSDITSPKVRRKVRTQVRTVIHTSGNVDTSNLPPEARRLLKCVQRANGNIDKLQACQ